MEESIHAIGIDVLIGREQGRPAVRLLHCGMPVPSSSSPCGITKSHNARPHESFHFALLIDTAQSS